MHTAAVQISPIPVEPDELLVDTSTDSVYPAIVVPAFRLMSGHNLKTQTSDYVGAVSSVGGE